MIARRFALAAFVSTTLWTGVSVAAEPQTQCASDRGDAVAETMRDMYAALSADNPRLIYCSEKGFLSGPYEHRAALDEVTQMMGGLAYMTGPPGRPLRAGTSVIDVTGGMFGAIGILAALEQRHRTGRGQKVSSALFETTVYLVGQHMAQMAVTGKPAAPMPVRVSAWAIYQVFETGDDKQVFVGVVSDKQWKDFCTAFELHELAADSSLDTNNDRVKHKDRLVPQIQATFRKYSKQQLMDKLEKTGLPFAPIARPEDLFDDPHLAANDGLVPITVSDGPRAGEKTRLPALPLEMDGARFGVHRDVPRAGQHTREVLREAGYTDAEIGTLLSRKIVAGPA